MSMSPEMGVIKPMALLPFPPDQVGTYSCHGVEPGMRQGETSAKINQDRGCVIYPFGQEACPEFEQALFCVFDGHGACGDKVSQFTAEKVPELLEKHPKLKLNPATALEEAFVTVDRNLKEDATIDAELSGTTAVVVLLRKDAAKGTITAYTANAGDSRAVVATTGAGGKLEHVDLSEDQKPDTPDEMKRIKKRGGFVSPPEEEWGGPARVWLDANMTLPGLAMARSIGDHLVKPIGVIAQPEVKTRVLTPEDKFIVMASDGVWEFIESKPAITIVNEFLKIGPPPTYKAADNAGATEACTRLIETAAAKWRTEEGDYRDDITAVCIKLPGLFPTAA